jgi:hypothetical protein
MTTQPAQNDRTVDLVASASLNNAEANQLLRKLLGQDYTETMAPVQLRLERQIRKGNSLGDTVSGFIACVPFGSLLGWTIQAAAYDLEGTR